MRYSQINTLDITNGKGIGVALYTTGCRFYCKNCFNKELWDINGGKQWTLEVQDYFLSIISPLYIDRVTILGGEPLLEENINDLQQLLNEIKYKYPQKNIWLYSGYTWEQIISCQKKKQILPYIDILVDGLFVEELKDLTLKWKGSSNQRVVDVQSTLISEKIILYNT